MLRICRPRPRGRFLIDLGATAPIREHHGMARPFLDDVEAEMDNLRAVHHGIAGPYLHGHDVLVLLVVIGQGEGLRQVTKVGTSLVVQTPVFPVDVVEGNPQGDPRWRFEIASDRIIVRQCALDRFRLVKPGYIIGRKTVAEEMFHDRNVFTAFEVTAKPGIVPVQRFDRALRYCVQRFDRAGVVVPAIAHFAKLVGTQIASKHDKTVTFEVGFQAWEV